MVQHSFDDDDLDTDDLDAEEKPGSLSDDPSDGPSVTLPPANLPRGKLPPPLTIMLSRARKKLQAVGDDGTLGTPRKTVAVQIGWPEMRAIYNIWTALGAARTARDTWKQKALVSAGRYQAMTHKSRTAIAETNLLNNRAIVALLVDVERILAGEDVSESEMHGTRNRVHAVLERARKRDRRKRATGGLG